MKCETCGMERGEHDRACWEQQLHAQKMRIVKRLVEVKKQYGAPMPGTFDINKLCTCLLDSVINIVTEA